MSHPVPVPRHLAPRPEDARPRLARLGHPDEMTGMEPPVQRMANYLIAAERELSHVQSRFFEARRGGDPDAIAAATARQDAAKREIGRLARPALRRAPPGAHAARSIRTWQRDRAALVDPAPRRTLSAAEGRQLALGVSLQGYRRDPGALARYVDKAGRPPAVVHTFQTLEAGLVRRATPWRRHAPWMPCQCSAGCRSTAWSRSCAETLTRISAHTRRPLGLGVSDPPALRSYNTN